MRSAEARFKASTIKTISMRLSLVGAQVDWMTKTSLPRTFSLISTVVSPSENLETKALPRGIPSLLATWAAKAGLALPVKIIKLLSDMSFLRHSRYWVKSHIRCNASRCVLADNQCCTPGGGRCKRSGRGRRIRTFACRDQNPVP